MRLLGIVAPAVSGLVAKPRSLERKIGLRRPSQTAAVLLSSAVICALYLPCALWLNADYIDHQRVPPKGAIVRLGYFNRITESSPTDDFRGKKQLYGTVFRWTEDPDEPSVDGARDPHIFVYENDRALGSPFIQYLEYSKSYTFTFSTSDDSDPRLNGKDYWVVRR